MKTTGQLPAPSPKGLLIQPRELADQADATTSQAVRFQGRYPAPLSLIKVSEQSAQLMMSVLLGMAGLLLAESAWTLMRRGHVRILPLPGHETGK